MYQQFGRGKRFLGCEGGYRRSRIGRIGGEGVQINERGRSRGSRRKYGIKDQEGSKESKINDGGR